MAATITDNGELTYASFGIEKTETDENGDIVVYGKCSDGNLDSDNQVVDPGWMKSASLAWKESGANLRVQHNPQRDPAGVGLEVNTDTQGNTWLKGLVMEPIAKKLVSKGALRAYSVGIARPTIVRDATAPGGRITGGELVEVSLVDRPANKRCGIQLMKSVDGSPEFTNDVFGSEEDITKALETVIAKGGNGGDTSFKAVKDYEGNKDMSFSMPEDMSWTFTPNDLAKILSNKFVEQHYDQLAKQAVYDAEETVYKTPVDAATRRRAASSGNALPDGSYPIEDVSHLHSAAILARSGHGDVSAARALIARRAKELGVSNPLSDTDDNKIIDTTEVTPKEADPNLTKKPKKAKGGKKLPPWLNKPADGDADDKGSASSSSDCKMDHAHTEKCSPSGTPASASGAKDAAPMKEIPSTSPAPESPMPSGIKTSDAKADTPEIHSSPEMAAMLRFKTVGIDTEMGRLHDLSCPAFHPDEVAKYHPFADFKSVVNEDLFRHKALEAAAGKSLSEAMEMQAVWQAARLLKNADPALINDIRLDLYKAFRDANPGPTTYPSPGSISPSSYNRPLETGGHAASSPGHSGPNSSPSVASGPVSGAHDFDKPPLSAGHQTPSPSFMKNDFEVPQATGTPVHLTYAHMEKEQALVALARLHTNLMAMVPNVCPMDMNSRGVLTPNPMPSTEGVGKDAEAEVTKNVEGITKAPLESEFSEEYLEKAFKKMRKKLGKKVLAGKITVDEARAKIGRTGAQKADKDLLVEQVDKGILTIDEARAKLGLGPWNQPETTKAVTVPSEVTLSVPNADVAYKDAQPDLIKSAIAEAISPLQEMLLSQQKAFEGKLAEQQKVIDAIADAPDPRGEPFSGLAVNMNKSARPAGVPDKADIAERTQQMVQRQLDHTFRTSENPAEREAAWNAMQKFRGLSQ